jgi:hypothetical protein
VIARGVGPLAVALELSRRGSGLHVRATLLAPDAAPAHASWLTVSFLRGDPAAEAVGRPCGAGCFSADVHGGRAGDRLRVRLRYAGRVHAGTFALPHLPAPSASALLARAARAWRRLESLRFRERLASGPAHAIDTTFVEQAPDRIAYRIDGGAQAIVIGRRRWDRDSPRSRWVRSAQSGPVHAPAPPWAVATDVRLLGETSTASRVSFVDRSYGIPTWFELTIDRTTYRTLDLRMTTAGHFMHDRYLGFDDAPPIRPPG